MTFQPPFCPVCPAALPRQLACHKNGRFRRKVDGRLVQRYLCRLCGQSFSNQTFRLDFRLRKPALMREIYRALVAKVTQRQCARLLGISRHTVAQRLVLLGNHCREFHRCRLERAGRPLLAGTFQLDELESFEHERRIKPLTVPVLIHRQSFFIVATSTASLPARGRLAPRFQAKKRALEERLGKRRSGSRRAVRECLSQLARQRDPSQDLRLETDRKSTYPRLVREELGARVEHHREDSKAPRCYGSVLFAINHTLAQLRDGLSRLVRRTWATTKREERLGLHLWVWMSYRNYVRPLTNRVRWLSSAMAIGLERKRWSVTELLELQPRFLPGAARG